MAPKLAVAAIFLGVVKDVSGLNWGADNDIYITSNGLKRYAMLHLPKAPATAGKIPLVVDNHAWGSASSMEMKMTGMSDVADREGFAVVYPEGYYLADPVDFLPLGVGYSFNAGACCPRSSYEKADDVLFVKDLIAHIYSAVSAESDGATSIDNDRVYAMGMSNGGFFTNRLGCQARNQFAAIASVSGMLVNGTSPMWGTDPFVCPMPDAPLPLLHFHGTADIIVPYDGTTTLGFPSVAEFLATRKSLNRIESTDTGTISYEHDTVVCKSYGAGASNTTVCTIDGTGHSWPGSKWGCPSFGPFKCNHDVDATEQIWSFFKRYSRSETIADTPLDVVV